MDLRVNGTMRRTCTRSAQEYDAPTEGEEAFEGQRQPATERSVAHPGTAGQNTGGFDRFQGRTAKTTMHHEARFPEDGVMIERDFSRQLYQVGCLVRRLTWGLGMDHGTLKVPFDHGSAMPMEIKYSLGACPGSPRRSSGRGPRIVLRDGHSARTMAELIGYVQGAFAMLQGSCRFWLGGQEFDLAFGSLAGTVRDGQVHDLLLARRILLTEVEGFPQLV